MAITVTLPKLYLELVATGAFGTPKILNAEVVSKHRVEAFLHEPETCRFTLKIGQDLQQSAFNCLDWESIEVGDSFARVDAWTVYIHPDEALGHAVLDFIILLVSICMSAFLLKIRSFIEWVERQVSQSDPIISSRKDKV